MCVDNVVYFGMNECSFKFGLKAIYVLLRA